MNADERRDTEPLPEGIHPAGRCSHSITRRQAHAPHLWVWLPGQDVPWRVVQPFEDAPAGTQWCDGGVPGAER